MTNFTESTERKIELTQLQARILEILGRGRANAIRREDLQKRTGINERKMREVIESLRREGYIILIGANRPYGYYLGETQEEVAEFIAYFRSRIVDECITLRDVKVAANKKFARTFGQIPMFIGGK